ncbi:Xaa-Pro dipeptidyl-peptidase [Amycolatopsis anabasis]|uniref:Xaa-Pro dipeptidyl-peptidase n=1 Tax=Amycolatopsis anabasis TaxID=1840409 RepID=UPI00131DEAA9|nr:Xaa-Pro dipeptidyl-peptidase [Amycolatopsis anabasis]
MSRRVPVILLALVLPLLGSVPALASERAFTLAGGVTQPVYSFADAIRETVWVDTGVDLDRDGAKDRVAADIIRPAEPAARGQKVPVIMDASPYYATAGRGNESELKSYDSAGRPVKFPLYYDNYFVPRGYAVILLDLSGTTRSRGCLDVGGRGEISSGKAVVDWLGGRADGYSTVDGATKVPAGWSTGAVGMIGKSWDGTMTNGVAATGVAGLRTIVPIAAISAWYDWFRSDGVSFTGFGTPTSLASGHENSSARQKCGRVRQEMTDGAPANGDLTPMWRERDFVKDASKVKASVFVVHGQNDWNVKPVNYGQWWDALTATGVPRKIWLSQTAHVDPFDFRRKEWVDTLHRWFDRWLLDVPNGIENEPQASIERSPDRWADDKSWPATTVRGTRMYPAPGGTAGVGTLSPEQPQPANASFTDDRSGSPSSWSANPDRTSASRVLFSTPAVSSDLRLSGTGSVTVKATPSTSTAHLSALLVDYGPATIRSDPGIRNLGTESCWGENRPGDDACYKDTATTSQNVTAHVISRGWADLANYNSLTTPAPLRPGTAYPITFRLSTVDHIVPAGHRLALIIGGTDRTAIPAPASPPKVTVDLADTSVLLPIVT